MKILKNNINNNKVRALEKVQYYLLLIYVIFVYLYNGNDEYYYLMYFPIGIFSIIELGYIIKHKKIYISKHILGLFIFALICILSCMWAIDNGLAISKAITVLLNTTTLLIMYNYGIRTKKSINELLRILLIAGTFFAAYILGYYGFNTLSNMFNSHYVRVGEEINNANTLGMELALTAIIAIYFGINKNKLYYFLAITPIILSFGTASKKAIIFIIVGTIMLIILKSQNKNKNSLVGIFKKFVFPLIILAAAISIIESGLFPTLTDRINGYSNSFTGEGKIDGSTITRDKYVKYGFSSFLEHPLTGIGIGNSGIITVEANGRNTYLHNNYIELLATVGIIGTIAYYYVFASLLLSAIKNRKDKNAAIIITILVLCIALDWGAVSYASKNTYIYILLCDIFYKKSDINNEIEKNENR